MSRVFSEKLLFRSSDPIRFLKNAGNANGIMQARGALSGIVTAVRNRFLYYPQPPPLGGGCGCRKEAAFY